MRLGKSLGLATGLVLATAVSASALTYAQSVVSADDNGAGGAGFRADSSNVLGAPDATATGGFYSLGIGGNIVVDFGTVFTGSGAVYEVTFGSATSHAESVDIFVSADNVTYTQVASVSNAAASNAMGASFGFAGLWSYMKLVDTSSTGTNGSVDGFDLDAVGVTAVPVPASALLLGAALAGLGVARRKS